MFSDGAVPWWRPTIIYSETENTDRNLVEILIQANHAGDPIFALKINRAPGYQVGKHIA